MARDRRPPRDPIQFFWATCEHRLERRVVCDSPAVESVSGVGFITAPPSRPRPRAEWVILEAEVREAGETYRPLEDNPGLFRVFAGLDPDDREALIQFADRYGMLGVWRAVLPPDTGTGSFPFQVAEPIREWSAEVRRMKAATWVWERYAAGETDQLAGCVTFDPGRGGPVSIPFSFSAARGESVRRPPGGTTVFRGVIPSELRGEEQVRAAAAVYLRAAITAALDDTLDAFLDDSSDSAFRMRFRPRHLLGALWLQFALAVTGDKRYRGCGYCGRWIEVSAGRTGHTSRREYCSEKCKVRAFRRRIGATTKREAAERAAKASGTTPPGPNPAPGPTPAGTAGGTRGRPGQRR